jgi:pyrophosphate--fructose-6-phosphate 1-phosphotransferase
MDEPIAEMVCGLPEIGIKFSGGPAHGGQNVIAGLYEAAKRTNPQKKIPIILIRPEGVECELIELTDQFVDYYRNLGGFTMVKTGRSKINFAGKIVPDALVVDGDDSNTNAAFLTQERSADGVHVIGVPKTIDGDIQFMAAEWQCLRILTLTEEGR